MRKFLRMITVGLSFSIVTVSFSAFAGATCFSTKQEYDKIKSKLPRSLQALPAIFTVDSFARAGLIIDSPKDNPTKLKLQMKIVSPMTSSTDEYIKSACLDKDMLTVTLEDASKSKYTVALSGNDLVVMNQTLVKSSMTQFNTLLSPSKKVGGMFGGLGVMGAQ